MIHTSQEHLYSREPSQANWTLKSILKHLLADSFYYPLGTLTRGKGGSDTLIIRKLIEEEH